MRFTRLRLIGFKTFVEPTDLLIEPGLTGVVGPNGCGKSNLVEALRWVMGESSHKSLRASGMDDVIFSGSGGRPARNTAEVALLVDNADRTAPAAFNDADQLDVSRRIEREMGSSYRINGRDVRARDVQLLFADASTGARSPAMVRQGQISEIISAKPQARRRILEEAAGIAGLHSRRHEAELRLRGAEENLLRLEDVLQQIEAQADGLRRQARQAQRYRNVAAEIRKAEAMLFYLGWREARSGLAEAERLVEAALRDVAERTGAQAQASRDQAVAAHVLPGLRDAEVNAAASLQRQIIARENLDAEERRAAERGVELERRAVELARDLERERALIDDAAAARDRMAAEAEELRDEAEGAAESQEEARGRLETLEEAAFDSEAALAAAQSALADRNARRSAAERTLREADDRLARVARDLERVRRDIAALDEANGPGGVLAELEAEREGVAASVAEAEEAAEAARSAHAAARDAENALRGPAQEADRAAQRLDAEMRTLDKMLAADPRQGPRLLDAVQVKPGYEAALAAALGDDLDASLDPAAPARWTGGGDAAGDPALPAGAEALVALVTAPAELARRLAQIGVVERTAGEALRHQLRPGQRLVSREGDLWRWDGYVVTAEAQRPAARRLAERNRLESLRAQVREARATADALRRDAEAAQAAIRRAAEEEAGAFDTLQIMRRGLSAVMARLADAQRKQGEVVARRSALNEALERLENEEAEAAERREATAAALEALVPVPALEAGLERARAKATQDRTAVNEARILLQSLTREGEMRQRRLAAIAADLRAWEERQARSRAQIEEIGRRQEEVEIEREQLREAPDLFLQRRRAILSGIETAEADRRAAADALATAERVLAEADRAAAEALAALSGAREAMARAEARREAADTRLAEVTRTIADRLDVEPMRLPALAEYDPADPLPEVEPLERRLETLRNDRERLGAVNLRADEELTEVETQRERLAGERDDLTEAIKRLRTAIQNLNREGRERLLAAFTVVQGHFERLFTSLFGGGEARLELVESDDPLEAGLEIFARPPGKKPQTMTLLSGGEQALTAIALIFAVFLTNPSPICVLDEVDAPLDDANVERYCDLLRDMARSTQTRFLVITHNPVTMARMDRLFGVTMAERGVSQLVSVDLDTAERFAAVS